MRAILGRKTGADQDHEWPSREARTASADTLALTCVFDNIFVERLWRTVKDEEVYLYDHRTVGEARDPLAAQFEFYNTERFHTSLGNRIPYEIYTGRQNPHQPDPWKGSELGSPYSASSFVVSSVLFQSQVRLFRHRDHGQINNGERRS